MHYRSIIFLQANSKWLSLSRHERNIFIKENLESILLSYKCDFEFEWVDSEAFSAEVSDYLLLKFKNLKKYHFLIEQFKDSKLICESYYDIKNILFGIIEGYKVYENEISDHLGDKL